MSKPQDPPDEFPGDLDRQADDEERHGQHATIRRIQKFRDHLAEYQVWFAQNEISKEVGYDDQIRSYHRMAQGLLRLLTQYLTDDEISRPEARQRDGGRAPNYYWEQVPIGSFTVEPPSVIQKPSRGEARGGIKNSNKLTLARTSMQATGEPKQFGVRGLGEYMEITPEWTAEWTCMFGPHVSVSELRRKVNDPSVTVHEREHRHEPVRIEKSGTIPKSLIDNAVTQMENFIRDIGLDIEFAEEEQQTKIDRDLLEEVDEWRQKNVQN